ncbi:MAG: purine-nucleoside phosphorylase [Clostridia bacterium]|jgi:purine-nucleoside phosphorylase|nr:purine-nucleoside phosphorylase [Clostridiales bacterium]
MEKYRKAAEFIEERLDTRPAVGLILGSGLGQMAEYIEGKKVIDYSEIPGFPMSTVEGHAGRLVAGELMGQRVIAMQGRFHYYEGYPMEQVVFPVRVMRLLGVERLIVTNAAGGINRGFKPGDLMIITDHINLMGYNPLIGANVDEMGERFPGMTNAYDRDLIKTAVACAKELEIELRQGVYCGVTGPSYETPAEIRMLGTIGGDAVGMSTVPEVITAVHCGMKVLGISCITNMAAGVLDHAPNHREVLEVGKKAQEKFIRLLKEILYIMH